MSTISDARRLVGIVLALIALAGGALYAQRRGFFQGERGRVSGADLSARNRPYDGRFTFVRLKYDTAPGGYWYRGIPAWAHGYPVSEQNLMRIMAEISYLNPRVDVQNVLAMDDPELFRYPVAYVIEPGWWTMSDGEVLALRTYLQKGGFLIVDDFKVRGWGGGMGGGGWDTFEEQMLRVLPGARFENVDESNPVFHSFFEIGPLRDFPQAYNAGPAVFKGIYDDNDPRKRLLVMINYNTDISQFWEWSGRGFRPVDDTNEAYKLGVNYLMYGLMH